MQISLRKWLLIVFLFALFFSGCDISSHHEAVSLGWKTNEWLPSFWLNSYWRVPYGNLPKYQYVHSEFRWFNRIIGLKREYRGANKEQYLLYLLKIHRSYLDEHHLSKW